MALRGIGVDVTLFASSDSVTEISRIGDHPSLDALERRYGRVAPGVPAALDALQLEALRLRAPEFDIVHAHGEFAHAALLGERRRRSLTTVHWRVDELDRALFFAVSPTYRWRQSRRRRRPAFLRRTGLGSCIMALPRTAMRFGASPTGMSPSSANDRTRNGRTSRSASPVPPAFRSASAARSMSAIRIISSRGFSLCSDRTPPISARSTTRRKVRLLVGPERCSSRSTGRSRSAW